MNLMEAVEHVFFHYAVFEGRARRSEFWYFQLFQFLVLFALGILSVTGIFAVLVPIFYLACFIPNLAVSWRRFHDIGRSGLWSFISYIPIVGIILVIVWLSQDSQPGDNQDGPNPKGNAGTYSRRHACIRWQQGTPVLIDLGSSYGTYLADGKQLPPNYPEPVAAGTRFYLGNRGNLFQIIVY